MMSTRPYVIDQIDPKTGSFDEHKVMIGFRARDLAIAAYDAAYPDGRGPTRRGAVSDLPAAQLKGWLEKDGATKGRSPLT